MRPPSLASLIDHSLLGPALSDDELRAGCELARRYRVASVCIKPYAVALAAELLAGSGVAVGTVVGFPHGSSASQVKAFEAEHACRAGAQELDVVVNIGKVLSGDWAYVAADIAAVLEVAVRHRAVTKVIFENDLLSDDAAKRKLCEICTRLGAQFVKTSTGYGFVKQEGGDYNYRGATDADLLLMRAASGPAVQVKAAGGVRTYEDACRVRDLGVARIGASATAAILDEEARRVEAASSRFVG